MSWFLCNDFFSQTPVQKLCDNHLLIHELGQIFWGWDETFSGVNFKPFRTLARLLLKH